MHDRSIAARLCSDPSSHLILYPSFQQQIQVQLDEVEVVSGEESEVRTIALLLQKGSDRWHFSPVVKRLTAFSFLFLHNNNT